MNRCVEIRGAKNDVKRLADAHFSQTVAKPFMQALNFYGKYEKVNLGI